MKKTFLILSLLFGCTAQAQTPMVAPPPAPLSLEQAWRLAEQNDVGLKAALNAVAAAEGQVEDARGLLWNNPELSAERNRRSTPQVGVAPIITREWTAGISQAFETGGQQEFRRETVRQDLVAKRHQADEIRQQLRFEVERRFVQVVALQLRIANEQEALKLSEDIARFAARRVATGEDSKLDGNVALVEAGRAKNQLSLLADQMLTARVELAQLLQWPAETLPEVTGELEPRADSLALDRLLVLAAERSQLKALQARESAARSRLDLERASRSPDVTLGLNLSREGPSDLREKVVGLSVSVPLPLFRRNAGNVAQASAELANVQLERLAGQRAAQAAVRSLWQRRHDLRARVQTLRDAVLPALDENQRLSRRALQEGEIGLAQLVLINRQVIEGRRDLFEALTELRLAQIALEQSAGWMPEGKVQ